jgi:hypothetical protein
MKTHLRYFLGLVLALGLFTVTLTPAKAFIGISVGIAPPPLPVYVQPACPGSDYMWTPGYWAWDADTDQYYWVPGAWVLAPEVGFLWTPSWWGWADGAYCFHPGYWGSHVGFYGGITYGNGYYGHGYDGGHWRGSHFYYNRAANNVSGIAASRTFSRGVAANTSRVSFNGNGGTTAVATADERRAADEHHIGATTAQNVEARSAMADPAQRYSVNHGDPRITGTTRAGSFHGTSASTATGATREESAFTGNSRTASSSERLNRISRESAFTGESRHVGESHFSALPSRQSSYHASSFHQPSFHSSSFSHSGGFGGGGSFAHASVSHVGGGGRGGGHGGGGHSGGGHSVHH